MINFDDYVNENKIQHKNWPYIQIIDKIYLYAKDPYESKYLYLIKKRERVGINHFNDPKAFVEY